MFAYSRNIFFVSLIIAFITALVLYIFVSRILIAPIRRLTAQHGRLPGGARERDADHPARTAATTRSASPSSELAAMETGHLLDAAPAPAPRRSRPRRRQDQPRPAQHADLGAAALRPGGQRSTIPRCSASRPRLVTTIDKAIGFAQSVLDYGRQSATPPKPGAGRPARAGRRGGVRCRARRPPRRSPSTNDVPDAVTLNVDPDQLARVFVNLLKNAREALEARTAPKIERPDGRRVAGRGGGRRDASASSTTAPACRRAPGNTCSSPSKARRAPAAPASASPSPASWSKPMAARWSMSTQAPGTRFDITLPRARIRDRLSRSRVLAIGAASPASKPAGGYRLGLAGSAGPYRPCAPLAQLDRAPDYESGGQEFESLRARHTKLLKITVYWRDGQASEFVA